VKPLKLFHARPNAGLSFEENSIREVIDQINRDHERTVLEFADYLSEGVSTPAPGGNVQENINPPLLSADILVVTIGHHYGEGWTEKEYDSALAQWQQIKRPTLLCYFKGFDTKPAPEWSSFFKKCRDHGCQDTRYADEKTFKQKLKNDLDWILDGGVATGRPTPEARFGHLHFGLLRPTIYLLSVSEVRKSLLQQLGLKENEDAFFLPSESQVHPVTRAETLDMVKDLGRVCKLKEFTCQT
jgi:hypothetical protein